MTTKIRIRVFEGVGIGGSERKSSKNAVFFVSWARHDNRILKV